MAVTLRDLRARDAARIEQEIGLPLQRWDEASPMVLYPKVLAAITREPEDKYLDMTINELLSMVQEDEPDPLA